jgi:hypothetical protein
MDLFIKYSHRQSCHIHGRIGYLSHRLLSGNFNFDPVILN